MPSGYLLKINSQTFLSLFNANFIDRSDFFFFFFVVLLWGFGVVIFVFANCYDIMTGQRFALQITTGSHYSIVVKFSAVRGYFTCSGES